MCCMRVAQPTVGFICHLHREVNMPCIADSPAHCCVQCSGRSVACRLYKTIEERCADYEIGTLHPGDLKPGLSRALNLMLAPVRKHFETDDHAKSLLKKVKSYKTTR